MNKKNGVSRCRREDLSRAFRADLRDSQAARVFTGILADTNKPIFESLIRGHGGLADAGFERHLGEGGWGWATGPDTLFRGRGSVQVRGLVDR